MPKSSKTSGKTNAGEHKYFTQSVSTAFQSLEERHKFYQSLKEKALIATGDIKPEGLLFFYLSELTKVTQGFCFDGLPFATWLRDPQNLLCVNPNAELLSEQARQYPTQLQFYTETTFKKSSKKTQSELISSYPSLFPSEVELFEKGTPEDKKNPEFIAYIFYVYHRYIEFLKRKVDECSSTIAPELAELIREEVETMANPTRPTLRAIMIVLKKSKYLDLMTLEKKEYDSKLFDKLLGAIYNKSSDSVRKIREAMIKPDKKNTPYVGENPKVAADILRDLGFAAEADKLEIDY